MLKIPLFSDENAFPLNDLGSPIASSTIASIAFKMSCPEMKSLVIKNVVVDTSELLLSLHCGWSRAILSREGGNDAPKNKSRQKSITREATGGSTSSSRDYAHGRSAVVHAAMMVAMFGGPPLVIP